jgi:hypothetical protein
MILLAILISSFGYGQKSDFVVTSTLDTIYVDKVDWTYAEVKTKTAGKKKKYTIEEIISYYIADENKYYVRVPIEQKERKAPEKYDYKRIDNLHLEDYLSRLQYKFIQRLTIGKVNLFAEDSADSPGPANNPFYDKRYYDKRYYISVYDSKLELITYKPKLFTSSSGLALYAEVYELLKIYLIGNSEINAKLDNLFIARPIAKEDQIVDLINEYNIWVESNK